MILPTLRFEKKLWKQGFNLVAGIDEVGRGSFAGPVVAASVVFSPDCIIPKGIADSKLLSPKIREKLAVKIKSQALYWAISQVSVGVINIVGIGKATQIAFRKVVKNLRVKPDFLLIDAFYIKRLNRKKQLAVKNGDKISTSIAAASIIAKVYRDNLMKKLHLKYPNYGFSRHKGYGTKLHQEAIRVHGLSKLHRASFNLEKFLNV